VVEVFSKVEQLGVAGEQSLVATEPQAGVAGFLHINWPALSTMTYWEPSC
jgi:hypothetical protein